MKALICIKNLAAFFMQSYKLSKKSLVRLKKSGKFVGTYERVQCSFEFQGKE